MPEPLDEAQLLVARAFAPDDVQMFGAKREDYTVWIPDGGQNNKLGAYVLAVAYAGNERVGIGELFGFRVSDERIVIEYTLTVDAVDNSAIEEWGRGQTKCLRVAPERAAGQPVVVAIVDPEDSDCDLFLDRTDTGTTDCEPLLYCDGSGNGDCVGSTPCVHGADACSIGSCSNKDGASVTCGDDTCVSDTLCRNCDLTKSPAEILECALLRNETHPSPDMAVPTEGSEDLCNDPTIIDVALPFPCRNPSVDAVSYYAQSAPFDFAIEPGPMPNTCRLTIVSTTDTRFSGVPHLLVTVELMAPRRTGFVLGLIATGGACPPAGVPIIRQYAPVIGTCPMPQP